MTILSRTASFGRNFVMSTKSSLCRKYRFPKKRSFRGVMPKLLDCDLEVREFEFQSRYYVHFKTRIHGKGINTLTPPTTG